MDYVVQYRCIYREHWYDYDTAASWNEAVALAAEVESNGRTARITDYERVLYQTP